MKHKHGHRQRQPSENAARHSSNRTRQMTVLASFKNAKQNLKKKRFGHETKRKTPKRKMKISRSGRMSHGKN
jgi:hypothetical protein